MSTEKIYIVWIKGRYLQFGLGFILLGLISACATQPLEPSSQPTIIDVIAKSASFPKVIRNNQTYILGAQSQIYVDDVLITDKRSKLELTMTDGLTLHLGPNTHFVLHQYDSAPQSSADLTMSSGSIKVSNRDMRSLEIRTPIAALKSNDGDFWCGFETSDTTLDIALLSGSGMAVSNQHGSTELT